MNITYWISWFTKGFFGYRKKMVSNVPVFPCRCRVLTRPLDGFSSVLSQIHFIYCFLWDICKNLPRFLRSQKPLVSADTKTFLFWKERDLFRNGNGTTPSAMVANQDYCSRKGFKCFIAIIWLLNIHFEPAFSTKVFIFL